MKSIIRKLASSLIIVALVVTLIPTVAPTGGTAYAEDLYEAVCTAYTCYAGGNGSSSPSGVDFSDYKGEIGDTFTIEVRGKGYDQDSPNNIDLHDYITKDDILWAQGAADTGSVELQKMADTEYGFSYTFVCKKAGAVTLTFSVKDSDWSQSFPLTINVDKSNFPAIRIDKSTKENLNTGYDGRVVFLTLETQDGGMYDPGKKYSKAKRGRVYTISEIKVVSSDESILKVSQLEWDKYSEWEDEDMDVNLDIIPVSPGTAYVRFYDTETGEKIGSLKVVITKKTLYNRWKLYLGCSYPDYGETFIKVESNPGDKIKVNLGGKTLNKTMPSTGKLKVTGLPVTKIGTKGSVTFTSPDGSFTATKSFQINDFIWIYLSNVKKSSKKVTATVEYAKKGDIIKLKVGKKTYKKKVKKDKNLFKFTQKIKKQKKGTKITVTVYNKFKQVRKKEKFKVKG